MSNLYFYSTGKRFGKIKFPHAPNLEYGSEAINFILDRFFFPSKILP